MRGTLLQWDDLIGQSITQSVSRAPRTYTTHTYHWIGQTKHTNINYAQTQILSQLAKGREVYMHVHAALRTY